MDVTHLKLMENGEKLVFHLHQSVTQVNTSALNMLANRLNFKFSIFDYL